MRLLRCCSNLMLMLFISLTGACTFAATPEPAVPTISADNAERVAQLTQINVTSKINSVAFSPDGKMLAAGLWDGTVQIWAVEGGELLKTLRGHTRPATGVVFSPDGSKLASGSVDGAVRLWQTSDSSLLHTLKGHESLVFSVAFSRDGGTLASGGDGIQFETVRLWNVDSGSLIRVVERSMGGMYGEGASNSVAFSPDNFTLASGSDDGVVTLWWNGVEETLVRDIVNIGAGVTSIDFSPSGETLALGTIDGNVMLLQLSDKPGDSTLHRIGRSTDIVSSVAFSRDGTILASGAFDGIVQLWKVSDGTLLYELEGHKDSISSVVFSPSGTILASGSRDKSIRLWSLSTSKTATTVTPTPVIGFIYYDPTAVAQIPLTGEKICDSALVPLPTPTHSTTTFDSISPFQDTITLGITLPSIAPGIPAQADATTFIQDLAEAIYPYGHVTAKNIIAVQGIKGNTLEVIAIDGLVSSLVNPLKLRYIHRAPNEGCIHISIVVPWEESTDSANNALQEEIKRLNDEYSWTSVSMIKNDNLLFETFYPFGTHLDEAQLASYLEWYDNAIFRLILMRLPLPKNN